MEGIIAILGTRATIASKIYENQILSRCPALELLPVSCPLFVPLVEEGYQEHPISTWVAQEYLRPLKNWDVKGVLLGCTHYPLLQAKIQNELGPEILLVDPAVACAQRTRELLSENNLLNPSLDPPNYQFFVSDDPTKFQVFGKLFLDFPIENVFQST